MAIAGLLPKFLELINSIKNNASMRILGVVSIILIYIGLRIFFPRPKKYDLSRFDILRDNVERIKQIYYDEHHSVKRWHDGKRNYYKVKEFPEIQNMIDIIPGVDRTSAKIYVMDYPMTCAPKLKRERGWMRYELTLRGGRGCVLDTGDCRIMIPDGSGFLYNPRRYHRYIKRSIMSRISLVIDVSDKRLCMSPCHQ